jgi:hypothetical protein
MTHDANALALHQLRVEALRRTLPGPTQALHTHISTLLLSGGFAYKLRKPLTLDFLDFATPEQRRADCQAELRLNRRTAPGLYLDVLPVYGPAEHARLEPGSRNEAAPVIDWVLRMQRFDNAALLDRLASIGALTAEHIDALARSVGAFHAALPPSPSAFGDPRDVKQRALDNFDALECSPAGAQHLALLRTLRAWTLAEFDRIDTLLGERRAQGFVREGHGDLHLGNIVMIDGQPTPFDCLEFNAGLRHGDVMGDAAFTFMDLARHGLPEMAWRFVNQYVEHTGDVQGILLLPFFAVYRAMVRAKVAMLRGAQAPEESADASRAHDALARDLQLAVQLSRLHQARPWLVVTSGVSGSGKSTVALALAESLSGIRLRSDVERKRLHGLRPTDRPGPALAPSIYGPEATERTYARLAALATLLLVAGRTVIVDSAALLRHEREELRTLAAASGAHFALVVCEAADAVLRGRIARRAAALSDPSDATLEVLSRQQRLREPVLPDEGAIVIDTDAPLPPLRAALLGRLGVGVSAQ